MNKLKTTPQWKDAAFKSHAGTCIRDSDYAILNNTVVVDIPICAIHPEFKVSFISTF